IVDSWRDQAADFGRAACAKLDASLSAQTLAEEFDEVLGGGMVELVASLIRGQAEVVQRLGRAAAYGHRLTLEQAHTDAASHMPLRAGHVIRQVAIVPRKHPAVIDQLRHLLRDDLLEAPLF